MTKAKTKEPVPKRCVDGHIFHFEVTVREQTLPESLTKSGPISAGPMSIPEMRFSLLFKDYPTVNEFVIAVSNQLRGESYTSYRTEGDGRQSIHSIPSDVYVAIVSHSVRVFGLPVLSLLTPTVDRFKQRLTVHWFENREVLGSINVGDRIGGLSVKLLPVHL